MTDHEQPLRSGTTSADSDTERSATGESTAAPIGRMLANPRRVRRT